MMRASRALAWIAVYHCVNQTERRDEQKDARQYR